MKCPNCMDAMESGFLSRSFWFSGNLPNRTPRLNRTLLALAFWPQKRRTLFVTAWRCPRCKKLELVTE